MNLNPFKKNKRIITIKRGEMDAEARQSLATMADAIVVEVSDPSALNVIEAEVPELAKPKQDAVFLPDMTDEEEKEWVKDNELGWGKFKKKLAEVGKAFTG